MPAVFPNRDVSEQAPNPHKVGYRINEWAHSVGICRSQVYELIAEKAIDSVKLGSARIITTSPSDFLRSLVEPKAA